MRPPLLSIAFLAIVLTSSALANTSLSISNSAVVTSAIGGKWFDYIVVIMLENHQINHTYGVPVTPNSWTTSSQTCLGNCTYFNGFANANGFAESYTNHQVKGSLGDYIAITSGDGSVTCNSPPGGSCGPFPDTNIVDRIEAHHLTWKAYMEGYPMARGCANSDNPSTHYSTIHNPFIYYQDISNNLTRCNNIVNANSINLPSTGPCWPTPPQNDNLFIGNLSSTVTASNYMFLTPNSIDDAHDCNDISVTNLWLNQTVPQILNSFVFRTQKAALFVTFDEPDCTNPVGQPNCPNPPKGYPNLYTVWGSNPAHPTTFSGHKSVALFDHFSQLRTVEDNWNLPTITANDAGATPMSEFLRP